MLLVALSLIDILVGISLMFPNFLGFYLGILVILKGLSSMLGIPTGDLGIVIMGVIDIAAGIMLLTNFSIPWFWLFPMIKGIYCFLVGFAS
jgi:uncharacterized membrane protein HdeD (DUF308 family)